MSTVDIKEFAVAAKIPQAAVNDRPIIIIGCARSGTSLLELMLHSHPRIAIPPENRFLMDLYNRRLEFGDLSKKHNRQALASWIIDREPSRFCDLGLDAEAVRQMILDGPPTIGSIAGIIFREYAKKHGKPRWGDKRPNYIREIDFVLTLFPDAQLIHIIRDGRDCVASLKRMPWWGHSIQATVYKWVEAIEAGNQARAKLRSDQYYEIQYEKLVSNPEHELRALCDYLGEEFHPAMLEHHKTTEAAIPEKYLQGHYAHTAKPVNQTAIGKWAKELQPKELGLIEAVGERQLRQFGYRLSGQGKVSEKLVERYQQHMTKSVAKAKRARRVDAERTREYNQPVQALLTKGQLEIYRQKT